MSPTHSLCEEAMLRGNGGEERKREEEGDSGQGRAGEPFFPGGCFCRRRSHRRVHAPQRHHRDRLL